MLACVEVVVHVLHVVEFLPARVIRKPQRHKIHGARQMTGKYTTQIEENETSSSGWKRKCGLVQWKTSHLLRGRGFCSHVKCT